MRVIWAFLAALVVLAALSGAAVAHEIRPAYLEITDMGPAGLHILWKQPVVGDQALAITPHLSSGWIDTRADTSTLTTDALIREWQIKDPETPVVGQTITIDGLERTITDVLVSISFANGTKLHEVISASHPQFTIPAEAAGIPVWQYLWLGVTHIWSGVDHLLYVLGLIMLVVSLRPLLWTLTSFTLAHSITLGLSTLNLLNVPRGPVEACIALSIVYLAVELVHRSQGRPGWASRRPYLAAFPFGLLHGFGFAGALKDVGLPQADIPGVLLFFNLGIEAGQIAFVVTVLAVAFAARRIAPLAMPLAQRWGPYVLGTLATYWLFGRIAAI